MIKLVVVLVVVVVVVFVYFKVNVGNVVFDVIFIKFDGQQVVLKDLCGKVVMVNFWVISCIICVGEMLQMIDIYNKFKDCGLDFVVVVMSYDLFNYVLNYIEICKLFFKVVLDL